MPTEVEHIQQAWGIRAAATATAPTAPRSMPSKPSRPLTGEDGVLRIMLGGESTVTPEQQQAWADFDAYAYGDFNFCLDQSRIQEELSDHRKRIVRAFLTGVSESVICETVELPAVKGTEWRAPREAMRPSPRYVRDVLESYQERRRR